MRLELKTTGGFAAFPGLQKPVVLEAEALEAADAAELERAVDAAHFFELPSSLTHDRELPDARKHVLTVTDAGRTHTVTRAEPLGEPGLAELVAFVRRRGKHAAAGPR